MKNLKRIMIVLILLISTGCTVKYEIEITDDLKIKENIDVTENNEKFEKIGTNNKTYIDMMYDVYSANYIYKSYNYKKIIGNEESGISAKKEYKSFDEYIKNNSIRNSIFRYINIEEENGIITYSATNLKYEEIFNELESNFPYDEILVTIKLPFEVTETNADVKETEKGKYTWIIDKNTTNPEIKLSFNKKLSIDKKIINYIKKNLLPIIIASVSSILIFLMLFIKHKRVNKI